MSFLDEQNPNRKPNRRKFMSTAVLIIDELGFQTLDRKDAHLLFKVISYRYERGATIITRWDEEAAPLELAVPYDQSRLAVWSATGVRYGQNVALEGERP